ncbi:helix-turn-helix domain-containing protein [Streptomyces sp. NPDC092307]|uniref:helix-turn-helix domain-containing protein n=1 Tax=Streptomyces sp. NPDC092307 TaxID=3366013 RepID=UPI003814F912
MTTHAPNESRALSPRPQAPSPGPDGTAAAPRRPVAGPQPRAPREPLWRDLVGDVLRRERLAQERTLKDVSEAARISMPYLSEVERGRKEASSEVLAAAAQALGLGLADLLLLAGDELARHARSQVVRSRVVQGRTSPTPRTARYDGLCLAA